MCCCCQLIAVHHGILECFDTHLASTLVVLPNLMVQWATLLEKSHRLVSQSAASTMSLEMASQSICSCQVALLPAGAPHADYDDHILATSIPALTLS